MAATPLRVLNTVKIPDLKLRFSPDVVPMYREAEIIGSKFHPRRPKYVALIANTPPDILRWTVSTDLCAKVLPLSTQRYRLRRRWTGAIITALRERGLDSKGRMLMQDEREKSEPKLRGTLEITVYAGYGFEEPADVLAKKSGEVVDALLKSGLVMQTPGKSGVQLDGRKSHNS